MQIGTRLALSVFLLYIAAGFDTSRIASTRRHGHLDGTEREEGTQWQDQQVQKVAKKESGERDSIGTCQCGGELKWARVVTSRPRMMQVCEKCGRSVFRESE